MHPPPRPPPFRPEPWSRRHFLQLLGLAGSSLCLPRGLARELPHLPDIARAAGWSVYRLQRPLDLLSIHLEMINLRVVSRRVDKEVFVREVHLHSHGGPGYLVLHFPGQHLAEQAVWDRADREPNGPQKGDPPPPLTYPITPGKDPVKGDLAFLAQDRGNPAKSPQGIAGAWISGPSQVVFEVRESDTPFGFEVDSLLRLCADRLPLVVAPAVQPRQPDAGNAPPPAAPEIWLGHHPVEDSPPFTAVEFPTLLYLSPYSNARWRFRPRTGARRSELWGLELAPPGEYRPGVPREQRLRGHLFAFAHRDFREAVWPLPKPPSALTGIPDDHSKHSTTERPKTSLYEATRDLLVLQLAEDNGDITADRFRLTAPGATARANYKPFYEPPGDRPDNGEGQRGETTAARLASAISALNFFGVIVDGTHRAKIEEFLRANGSLTREALALKLGTVIGDLPDPVGSGPLSADLLAAVAAAFINPGSTMKSRGLLSEWVQKTEVGRDFYTKESFAGFLMPFGFKAEVVTITERLPSTTHPAEDVPTDRTGPDDPIDLGAQEASLLALLVARKFVRVKPWRNGARRRDFASAESADFAPWLGEAGRTAGLKSVEILVERTPVLANRGVDGAKYSPAKIVDELRAGRDYIVDGGSGENAAREVFWPRVEKTVEDTPGELRRQLDLYRFPVRVVYLDEREETIYLPMLFVPTEAQGRTFYPLTPRGHRAAAVKEKVAVAPPLPAALIVDWEFGSGRDLSDHLPHLKQFIADPKLQALANTIAAPPGPIDPTHPVNAASSAALLAGSVNVFLGNAPNELGRRVTQFQEAVRGQIGKLGAAGSGTEQQLKDWFVKALDYPETQVTAMIETARRLVAWGMEEVGAVDAAAAADRLARILRLPGTLNDDRLNRIGKAIDEIIKGVNAVPTTVKPALLKRLKRLRERQPTATDPVTAPYEQALRELLIEWAIGLASQWRRADWDAAFSEAANRVDDANRIDILTAVFHKEIQHKILGGTFEIDLQIPSDGGVRARILWPQAAANAANLLSSLQPDGLARELDGLLKKLTAQAVKDIKALERLLRGVEAALADEGILRQRLHFLIEEYAHLKEAELQAAIQPIARDIRTQLAFAGAHFKDGAARLSKFVRAVFDAQDLVTHYEGKLRGELATLQASVKAKIQEKITENFNPQADQLEKAKAAVEQMLVSANPDRIKEHFEGIANLTGRRVGEELRDRLRRYQADAAQRLNELTQACNNATLALSSRYDQAAGKLDHFFALAETLAGRERALLESVLARAEDIDGQLDALLSQAELRKIPRLARWVRRAAEIARRRAVSPRQLVMLERFAADLQQVARLPEDALRRVTAVRDTLRQQFLDALRDETTAAAAAAAASVEEFQRQAGTLLGIAQQAGGEFVLRAEALQAVAAAAASGKQAVDFLDHLLLAIAALPGALEEAAARLIATFLKNLLESPLSGYLGKNWEALQDKLSELRRYVGDAQDIEKALAHVGHLGDELNTRARRVWKELQGEAENIAGKFRDELKDKVLHVEGEAFDMVKRTLVALPSPALLKNFAEQTGKAVHEAREVIFNAAENLGENLRAFVAHPSLEGITVKLPGIDDFPEIKHAGDYLKKGLRDFESVAGGVYAEVNAKFSGSLQSLGEAAGVGTAAAAVQAFSREAGAVAESYVRKANEYIGQARKIEHALLDEYHQAESAVKDLLKDPNALISDSYKALLGDPPPKLFGVIPLDKLLNVCLNLSELPKAIPNNLKDRVEITRSIRKPLKFPDNQINFALLGFDPGKDCEISLDGTLVVFLPMPGRPVRPPTYSTRGQIRDFTLTIGSVIGLAFKSLTFVSENGSFKCTPKFGKGDDGGLMDALTFMGPLEFVQTFASTVMSMLTGKLPFLLDFDGDLVIAKISIGLPTLGFGAVSIENITLRLAVGLPLSSSKALAFKFEVSDKIETFKVSVCGFAGGGYFGLKMSSDPAQGSIEAAIEFGGALALNVGFAKGSLSVMAGIYFRKAGAEVELQAYIRACGMIRVLGFIEISIVILLALSYESSTGALAGEVSISIRVKIGFFSKSFRLRYAKSFAGSRQAFYHPPIDHDGPCLPFPGGASAYLIAGASAPERISRLSANKPPRRRPATTSGDRGRGHADPPPIVEHDDSETGHTTTPDWQGLKPRRRPRYTDVVKEKDFVKHWARYARGGLASKCGASKTSIY